MNKKTKGKIIVIEGIDGSGKSEQFKLLVARLKKMGIPVETMDFPVYGSSACYFVEQYLKGVYGNNVSPYQASLFYAADRFDVVSKIKDFLRGGKVLVFNRYTFSNMGHQGGKIKNEKERLQFFHWLYDLEHNILGIPRPNLNVICDMPVEISARLIKLRDKTSSRHLKSYQDIHESDLNHLRRARKTYLEIAKLYQIESIVVKCAPKEKLLSIKEIHQKIWEIVKKELGI